MQTNEYTCNLISAWRASRILPFTENSPKCLIKIYDSLTLLVKNNEIIILWASYSLENEKMVDRKIINLMKYKYFINSARGDLIDESYLIKKIEENYFYGVALDVISDENLTNNLNKFKNISPDINFILTPHIGGAMFESMVLTKSL